MNEDIKPLLYFYFLQCLSFLCLRFGLYNVSFCLTIDFSRACLLYAIVFYWDTCCVYCLSIMCLRCSGLVVRRPICQVIGQKDSFDDAFYESSRRDYDHKDLVDECAFCFFCTAMCSSPPLNDIFQTSMA